MIRNISDYVPLQVFINDVRIIAFKTFTIENTFTTFADALSMEIANLVGKSGLRHYSNEIRLGMPIEVKWESDSLFKGTIEDLRSMANRDNHTLSIQARDSLSDVIENLAEPLKKTSVNDNDLLQKLLGSNFTYELETAKVHKDFSIGDHETKGQVVERLAKLGGFMLWNEGTRIIKAKPAASGEPRIVINSAEGHFLMYELSQSIQNAKSKITGFGSSKEYKKKEFNTSVPLEIQLRQEVYTPSLTREVRVQLDQSDEDEQSKRLAEQVDASQPTEQITFSIGGIVRLDLNSLIQVKIPEENIDRLMNVISRRWVLESSGLRKTEITCILPGRKIWRN